MALAVPWQCAACSAPVPAAFAAQPPPPPPPPPMSTLQGSPSQRDCGWVPQNIKHAGHVMAKTFSLSLLAEKVWAGGRCGWRYQTGLPSFLVLPRAVPFSHA